MSIRIIKQGLLDTVQDAGRFGYQHLGINPTGAMDIYAATVANILAGNAVDEAVIEMHFPAATIYFEKDCLIALSGADFYACINDERIPINTAVLVAKGCMLSFKKWKCGARVYFAMHGGFVIEKWLYSYSTNLKAGTGGFKGRALIKEDTISTGNAVYYITMNASSFIVTNIGADISLNNAKIIRCLEGIAYKKLNAESIENLTRQSFAISRQSDRMGYGLEGSKLMLIEYEEQLSSAVTNGTVQLLPDGSLIVLMADHQTTGGYPVIAHVITADIPLLAQMQPGTSFRFQFVTIETAEHLYENQQYYLQQLQAQTNLRMQKFFQ